MTGRSSGDVTLLLHQWRCGDRAAYNKLIPLVHEELRRLAHFYMNRERAGHSLQTSALVNEAYLRLVDADRVDWQDRTHFLAVSANIMRRVLIHHARLRCARKRGGSAVRVDLEQAFVPSPERDEDLIALDEALDALSRIDPREARVVELRFFGGLSEKEASEVLGVSERTIRREWAHAKAWLYQQLKQERKE